LLILVGRICRMRPLVSREGWHQAGATKELNRIEFEESGDGISAVFLSLRFNTEHRRYVDLMAIR
jgi:hypothetical protein